MTVSFFATLLLVESLFFRSFFSFISAIYDSPNWKCRARSENVSIRPTHWGDEKKVIISFHKIWIKRCICSFSLLQLMFDFSALPHIAIDKFCCLTSNNTQWQKYFFRWKVLIIVREKKRIELLSMLFPMKFERKKIVYFTPYYLNTFNEYVSCRHERDKLFDIRS